MYPESLPDHGKKIYLDTFLFEDNLDYDYIRSFYHDKKRIFPINMHRHNFYEINIISSGSGYHYIEDHCVEADFGSVFIIPPYTSHGYYTENEDSFSIFHVIIHPEFMKKYEKELKSMDGFSTLFVFEPNLRKNTANSLFLKLNEDELNSLKPLFDRLVEKDLYVSDFNNIERIDRIGTLLSLISRLSFYLVEKHQSIINDSNDSSLKESVFIIEALKYISDNYTEKLTIEKLAKLSLMSRASFIRHFESYTKKSFNQYLTEIRIDAACGLLEDTKLSITKISQRCGFYDSAHFSKIFLKNKGYLPSEYRIKMKK